MKKRRMGSRIYSPASRTIVSDFLFRPRAIYLLKKYQLYVGTMINAIPVVLALFMLPHDLGVYTATPEEGWVP